MALLKTIWHPILLQTITFYISVIHFYTTDNKSHAAFKNQTEYSTKPTLHVKKIRSNSLCFQWSTINVGAFISQ